MKYLELYTLGLSCQASNSHDLTPGGSISKYPLLSKLTQLLERYIQVWRADCERKEESEKEAASLYSYRQHGQDTEPDERELERLTQESFPSFTQVCSAGSVLYYLLNTRHASGSTYQCIQLNLEIMNFISSSC